MPMYFPDLKSIQQCVKSMRMNKDEKHYDGIYPETTEQLPEAREALAKYFRDIWDDEIQAMEVELAVSEGDYHEKIGAAIRKQFTNDRILFKDDPRTRIKLGG